MAKKRILIIIFILILSLGASLSFLVSYYEEILINQEAEKNEVIAQNNINNIKFHIDYHLIQLDDLFDNNASFETFNQLQSNLKLYYDATYSESYDTKLAPAYLKNWIKEEELYFFVLVKPIDGALVELKLSAQTIYEQFLAKVRLGERGYTSLKDKDGVVIMHIDENQIGVDTFNERYTAYPELDSPQSQELLYNQYHLDFGSDVVESYWWEEEVAETSLKLISYASNDISGFKFVTTVVVEVSEVIAPIRSLTWLLVLIACVLVLVVGFMIYHFQVAKRKEESYHHQLELAQYEEQFHAQENQMQKFEQTQTIAVFSNSLAHELNNMLTPSMIYCDLLRQKKLSQEISEIVEQVVHSIEHCKGLTTQLKEVAKQSNINSYEVFDLNKWLLKQMQFLRYLVVKRIVLKQQITNEECFIKGNQRALQQVLINLIHNAIQAIENEGCIVITLKIHDTCAVLKISDTGVGMDENTQNKIFEPFFTTKKEEGTGLGLSVVKTIINNHNGTIQCQSVLHEGTDFIIEIPINYE